MKILITGANGQLGYEVEKAAKKKHHSVFPFDCDNMDITDKEKTSTIIDEIKPDCIIHCAAWTAVDDAEDNEEKCALVNFYGTKNIVEAAKKADAKIIYVSTDYVFDGQGDRPWKPQDKRSPINVYGKTKYQGELEAEKIKKHFIVRTAWVFGKGKNFVKTMMNLAKDHNRLTVVDDQIGTPTYTADLAELLVSMAESESYGTYHATNSGGYISWCDFAKEIFKITGDDVEVVAVSSENYKSKAKRPKNSRLDKNDLEKNGFEPLPTWQDALKRYIDSERK